MVRKKFLLLILMILSIMPNTVFAEAEENQILWHNSYVRICGVVGDADSPVSILVKKQTENTPVSDADIGYMNEIEPDSSGEYTCLFSIPNGENITEYVFNVMQNGICINNTVKEAVAFSDLFELNLQASDNSEVGQAFGYIKSKFGYNNDSYNFRMLLTYYDENNALCGAKVSDFKSFCLTEKEEQFCISELLPETAVKIKAFAFNNLEALTPLAKASEAYVGQNISCWGDSLTWGSGATTFADEAMISGMDLNVQYYGFEDTSEMVLGGSDKVLKVTSYPAFLQHFTNKKVHNYGYPGAGSRSIYLDQGASFVLTYEPFTIPASKEEITELKTSYSNSFTSYPIRCQIKGIDLMIMSSKVNSSQSGAKESVSYKVKRISDGNAVYIPKGTEIVPNTRFERCNDINVIWMGTNGLPPFETLSGQIDDMIKVMKNDKYIILGVLNYPNYDVENAMIKKYGDKFIPLKSYFSRKIVIDGVETTQGLYDYKHIYNNNFEQSKADEVRFNLDLLPKSFCNTTNTDDNCVGLSNENGDVKFDTTHFNARGYKIIAHLVYERMQKLGYIVK